MKTGRVGVCLLLLAILASTDVVAQEQAESGLSSLPINVQKGPTTGSLGTIAEITVPAGYIFTNAEDTRVVMEAMQNPITNTEVGMIGPESLEWFVVFEFDEIGYVKDDERESLDADALLESIRAGNEEGNKEREKRGWAPLHIVGWEQPPHYDPATNNLEWATRIQSEGELGTNFNTRLLGRTGVMRVTLVTDVAHLQEQLPLYRSLMSGFSYRQGSRYADYRQGDQVAKYGLSALVLGGATAVAAKSGLLKAFGKGIIFIVALAAGAVAKFGRAVKDGIARLFGSNG